MKRKQKLHNLKPIKSKGAIMIAYYDGKFSAKEEIFISPDDRGFLLADGLYEVVRSYNGKLFCMEEHIERLNYGARELRLENTDFSSLGEIARQLLEKNNLQGDATVYLQVTRGVAARKHAFPAAQTPLTVFASASPFDAGKGAAARRDGGTAITLPDQRWARCDMKTIGLTANVLANQEAVERGVKEALFVRDGVILEGTHTNFFGVMDGCLVTAPANNYILGGITRKVTIELARELDIPVKEKPVFVKDIPQLAEAFITGTTTEIMPIISIDNAPVGDGRPGPVTIKLQEAYAKHIA